MVLCHYVFRGSAKMALKTLEIPGFCKPALVVSSPLIGDCPSAGSGTVGQVMKKSEESGLRRQKNPTSYMAGFFL